MSRPFEIEIQPRSRGLRAVYERSSGLDALRERLRGVKDCAVLSASALRGALRETLESLLRGTEQPACAGGAGDCAAEGQPRCPACQLFGARDAALAPEMRRFANLVLGDATAPVDALRWRPAVGIAVPRGERGIGVGSRFPTGWLEIEGKLLARGRLLDPERGPLLEAAVRGTTHLGSDAAQGLGRVELALRWLEAPPEAEPVRLPEGDAVSLRVALRTAAAFGTPASRSDWRDTRREIPGAALRGALGFALRERFGEDWQPEQRALFDPETGARFGFLYPVRRGRAVQAFPGPWPITARVCASAGHDHGVLDSALPRIRAACAGTPEGVARAWSARPVHCPVCGAGLEEASGLRDCVPAPATRLVARSALDRSRRARASEADVRVEELLDPSDEVVFEGAIEGIPETSRAALTQALSGPLALGRGVSLGRGEVRVEVAPPRALPALSERGEAFDRALEASLRALALETAAVGEVLPIALRSPLIPEREDDDGSAALAVALGAPSSWLLCARRFCAEGGFDQRAGRAAPARAVAAGAVFVARLPGGWRAHQAALERLERSGVGARRHQGYGRLLCFDPFTASTPTGESRS